MKNVALEILGSTTKGLPLLCFDLNGSQKNNDKTKVLILGGVHGDEYEGVVCAEDLLVQLSQNPLTQYQFKIIPRMNPEGVLQKTRGNSNSIDLNRNLPTKDWTQEFTNPRYQPGPSPCSEKENKVLVKLIQDYKPDFILSLHSWKPLLNINGACRDFAELIALKTGYSIETDIGYPTPGSLGTYAGLELQIPTLTYEIERGLDEAKIIQTHSAALIYAFKTWRKI